LETLPEEGAFQQMSFGGIKIRRKKGNAKEKTEKTKEN
jgi:hypothetical protein